VANVNRDVSLTVALCVTEILTLVGVFSFPALLPIFFEEWALSKTDAGWISGIYWAGNALAAGVLVSLTDRIDARWIYLGGAAVGFIGSAGFALFADGFWTALLFRALAGVGLAGTYIPGLRALIDRFKGPNSARAIAIYTGTFSLGTATSFLVSGAIADAFGWRWSFAAAGAAAALAFVIAAFALGPAKPERKAEPTPLLDFRPVLSNRPAMGYILGYAVHTWELTSLRSWTVAYLVFAATLTTADTGWFTPITVATLSAVVAWAASVAGGELTSRFDRRRTIALLMVGSAIVCVMLGFAAPLPYPVVAAILLVYAGFVQSDAGALNTGTTQSARVGQRGLTLALHSMIGMTFAFLGPLAFGMVLDATGGGLTPASWATAFALMGVSILVGPLILHWARPRASSVVAETAAHGPPPPPPGR